MPSILYRLISFSSEVFAITLCKTHSPLPPETNSPACYSHLHHMGRMLVLNSRRAWLKKASNIMIKA